MNEMPNPTLPTQIRLDKTPIEWRPIAGYESRYEVSNDGRVRSLPNRTRKGVRELAQGIGSGGYKIVTLYGAHGRSTALVHRLVATAFCGVPNTGDEVCHSNGLRTDNRAANLRWDTRSANQRDAVAHGTHAKSRRVACPAGHGYTAENTYERPNGSRRCRECHRSNERTRKAKNRGLAE